MNTNSIPVLDLHTTLAYTPSNTYTDKHTNTPTQEISILRAITDP